MAELADALDSGSSRGNSVEVQVLLPAPKAKGSALHSLLLLVRIRGHAESLQDAGKLLTFALLVHLAPERSEDVQVLLPST